MTGGPGLRLAFRFEHHQSRQQRRLCVAVSRDDKSGQPEDAPRATPSRLTAHCSTRVAHDSGYNPKNNFTTAGNMANQ
jgi:hypothetical protein